MFPHVKTTSSYSSSGSVVSSADSVLKPVNLRLNQEVPGLWKNLTLQVVFPAVWYGVLKMLDAFLSQLRRWCQGDFRKNKHIGHVCPKIRNISTWPPRSASTPLSSASWPKRAARMKSTGAPLGTGKFGISAGLCVSMNLLLLANIQTHIGHDMFVVVSRLHIVLVHVCLQSSAIC